MPFGLTNAPNMFMWLMTKVLKEFLGKFVIVYLDGIMIFSKKLEEHLMHIQRVFENLREDNFLINLKKWSFVKIEFVYLGFFVSMEGLKMDLEKVKAIIEWSTPRSATKVRYFHVFECFYRNFFKGFSSICAPLTEKMRGDRNVFKWTIEVAKNFDMLKKKVTKQPVDFKKVFQLDFDAIGNAIRAILSKKGKPIAYFSENLNDANKKYFVYDQKFCAIF
jgi:hypothetical protein